ncbi:hypothetical protein H0H93_012264 [Arthromyces matolae]|nr:hypothetical protein H0H93_012264 [Arthromyces matolae]
MSSQPSPPPPPVPASPPNTGGVRRHHTISASSRAARGALRDSISEEVQDLGLGYDDEVVDEDWVGGVGAVGEKSSLHRQSSLPTKYHRGFQGAAKSGSHTPKTVNSLAAIAGHEGDEEPWNIASAYGAVEEEHPVPDPAHHQQALEAQSQNSPLSSHFVAGQNVPSPPSPASNVRRHVSLTYGAASRKPPSGLKRSGTLQAPMPPPHNSQSTTPPDTSESVEEDDYNYEEDLNAYDEAYGGVQQQVPSQGYNQIGRQSPWAPQNEWRAVGGGGGFITNQNAAVDDVQRALSALEIASNQSTQYNSNLYQGGQSAHPPRFNPAYPPPTQAPGLRSAGNAGNNGNGTGRNVSQGPNVEGRKTPVSQGNYSQQQYDNRSQSSGSSWDSKDRSLNNRSSNPNLQQVYQQGGKGSGSNVPSVPPIPPQYLQQQQQSRVGNTASYNQSGGQQGQQTQQQQQVQQQQMSPTQNFMSTTPIDVPSLIATKGYNPTNFDIRPQFARYFVIKSYTEDDVHKSLKYEIWSSTDPGNKRLDKAFKETANRGPIYLFFSVNASNTQERKPVTNSRDTQELLPDAGQEMLRIFHTHPARTSLLQDFAFYELQAMQKLQSQPGSSSPDPSDSGSQSPPQQPQQPRHQAQQQQNMYGMPPMPNPGGYGMPQMSPMLQMQMQMNMMGLGGGQYVMPQAMHQSVMRHPSPGPQNMGF